MRTCSLIVLAALAVAGCQHKPDPIRSTPTPVSCVKDIPPEPEKVKSQLNGDWAHDGPILAVSALDLRDWGEKLAARLVGCR